MNERSVLNVVVIMGVSGAGKTAVGRALAAAIGWAFYEGDDYHPRANIEKISRAQPLTDDDRAPWLAALHQLIARIVATGSQGVLACSALKHSYRKVLVGDTPSGAVRIVFLEVPPEILRERLAHRVGHFAPPEILPSQLAALEVPRSALHVDGARPIEEIVATIRSALGI